MRRLAAAFLALVLLILTAVPAHASYSVPDDTTVYVTTNGKCYHRAGCTYLLSEKPLSIKTAVSRGYKPCSRCYPDRLTGRYESDWDGQSGGSSSNSSQSSSPSPSRNPNDGKKGWIDWKFVFAFLGISILTVFSFLHLTHEASRRLKQKMEQAENLRALERERQEMIRRRTEQKRLAEQQAQEQRSNEARLQAEAKEREEEAARQEEEKLRIFEEEKAKYTQLYGGKSPEESAGMPYDLEIGSDGLPKKLGASGWGEQFTYYVTHSGTRFHKRRGCCGATVPLHLWSIGAPVQLCLKCRPSKLPDLRWYAKYLEIRRIKEIYNID